MSRRRKPLIPQRNLGNISMSGYKTSIRPVSVKELQRFVHEEVQEGPQIISLPVPPFRHAFLLDIQPKRILIGDWNGTRAETFMKKDPAWKQYADFLVCVQQKFPHRAISFYPVDKDIHRAAEQHDRTMGGGGCSFYLFAWLEQSPLYSLWSI